MVHLFFLTEFSILQFLFKFFGRKPIYLLPSNPVIAPTAVFLGKLKKQFIRFSWVNPITVTCPDFTAEWEHPRTMLSNIFGSIEKWQNQYFRFDLADDRLANYGLAYRQIVCNYISSRLYAILAISEFESTRGEENFLVSGLSSDMLEAYEVYNSKNIKNVAWSLKLPNYLSNFIISIVVLFYTVVWMLSRIRFYLAPAKKYSAMIDWVDDSDDVNLYRDMAELGEICLIRRPQIGIFESFRDPEIKDIVSNCDMYQATDGVLTPTQVFWCIWKTILDGAKIYLFAGRYEPALFYKVISLPYKTIVYRSLFRRIEPKIYWSRDAYNVEHIVRRQELKAVNGQSWCYLHGYPTYTSIFPMFRYVSFDRLYAVSRHFYEKDYYSTWDPDMEVVDASTFRASRRVFSRRSKFEDKPPNIVVLCSIFVREPGMLDFVATLASSFPDRKVYLQIKSGFRELQQGVDLIEQSLSRFSNVDTSISGIYELFSSAKYVFSDPSTAIMEALQFGSMGFAIDISSKQSDYPLREFNEICLNSGQTAVKLINSIEDGSWVYPIDKVKALANLEGECFADKLRRDLGLPPIDAPRSVW